MLRRMGQFLGVYYAHMLEYRAELFFWVLSGSLPLIMLGIWLEAAASGDFVLTPVEFARYFFAAFLARQFSVVWVVWEFEREIVQGQLSNWLLQPVDPGWRHVAEHVGERLARLPFIAPIAMVFFVVMPEAIWWPGLGRCLGFVAICAAAFALRFIVQYTFAMVAFWSERASAIDQIWFLLFTFLSGYIAPLAVFPEWLQTALLWTPFPYFIDVPAAILMGQPVNGIQVVGVMAAWGGLFWLINRLLWRRGLKQYSGMGA